MRASAAAVRHAWPAAVACYLSRATAVGGGGKGLIFTLSYESQHTLRRIMGMLPELAVKPPRSGLAMATGLHNKQGYADEDGQEGDFIYGRPLATLGVVKIATLLLHPLLIQV